MLRKDRQIFFLGAIGNPFKKPFLGGQSVIVQHVNILRGLGYSAYIVTQMGRLERWKTPLQQADPIFISSAEFKKLINCEIDIVVLPGRYLEQLDSFPGKNKVLFSQGAFITLNALDLNASVNHWKNPTLRGIICVSEGNEELLQHMAPICPLAVIPNFVPAQKISQNKEASIVFPPLNRPEKNPLDTKAVLQLIRAKLADTDTGKNIRFIELSNLPFETVQAELSRASVLLFLGINEGLPLLVLEAMSFGTIPIGYNRRSVSDLLHPKCIFEISELNDIADTAIDILLNPERWEQVRCWSTEKAREYSQDRQRQALINAWATIECNIHEVKLS